MSNYTGSNDHSLTHKDAVPESSFQFSEIIFKQLPDKLDLLLFIWVSARYLRYGGEDKRRREEGIGEEGVGMMGG